jgi:hypothetical protein
MAKQQSRSKPLIERIQDRIRDLLDGLAESLDGFFAPAPEPIPVRQQPRMPRR